MNREEKIKRFISDLFVFGKIDRADIKNEEIEELENFFSGTNISLIKSDSELALARDTNKDALVDKFTEAQLEVLTLILYMHPINKAQIDFIRGVSSSSTLKKLQLSGYIEKNNKDFYPSAELLASLGLKSANELDDFHEFRDKMNAILNDDHDY